MHPQHDIYYYADLIRKVKRILPQASVKAFTAIELAYMIDKAGLTPHDGLALLKEAGMEAIPAAAPRFSTKRSVRGSARRKGVPKRGLRCTAKRTGSGFRTNATILYGHVENWEHRIDHLDRLRTLQDETGGFNAFIPLKYRSRHNSMSEVGEVSVVEDMRMTALARVYLDNFPHIKAYWPMFGKTTAQIALAFGADDMDGTIDDSTKIYSMAGAEDQSPAMTAADMERLIRDAGYLPVERDTFTIRLKSSIFNLELTSRTGRLNRTIWTFWKTGPEDQRQSDFAQSGAGCLCDHRVYVRCEFAAESFLLATGKCATFPISAG